ncbi:FHA domain-containing protein [Hoyosella rhizosphaerae]|nr:FHA domain-containing protein [Hoyosella rhizosphaerae]MBN4927451.1 FHA domain-containing protein [Hoyosella rhizosphaerae]
MQGLILQLTRGGFLLLLVLFVLAVMRVLRADIYAGAGLRAPSRPPRQKRSRGLLGRSKVAHTLVVTHGALAGTRITLDQNPILIGRADDSTLVLTDDYASNRHARISPRGSDWYLEDLGSTNGTYLDRAKVTTPVRVPLGTPIRVGKTAIELRP